MGRFSRKKGKNDGSSDEEDTGTAVVHVESGDKEQEVVEKDDEETREEQVVLQDVPAKKRVVIEKGSDDPISVRLRQIRAITYKNALLSLNNWPTTLLRLLMPAIFVVALWVISTYGSETPERVSVPLWTDIPRCTKGAKPCYTITYAPQDNVQVRYLIDHVRRHNNPVIPESEVRGFDTPYALDDWLKANQNQSQGGYVFWRLDTQFNNLTIPIHEFRVAVQLNTTMWPGANQWQRDYYNTIFAAYHTRIMAAELDFETENTNTTLKFDGRDFVKPLVVPPFEDTATMGLFILASFFIHLIFMVNVYVGEKENRLRLALKQAGLKDSVFWLTWFINDVPIIVASIAGMGVAGYFLDFGLFVYNDWQTYTVLFVEFSACMNALAFLLSSFISKVRVANIVAFLLFLIFMVGNGITSTIIYTNNIAEDVRFYVSFAAPVVFQKGLDDLLAKSISTEPGKAPEGIRWADIATHATDDIYPLQAVYMQLLYDWAIYFVLAWYLDNVLPNSFAASRSPWFFLTPSYWTGRSLLRGRRRAYVKKFKEMDDDVEEEREVIMGGNEPDDAQIVVRNLRKVYKRYPIVSSASDFEAVKDICYYIKRNTLFCLLGPNGAGKTTTLSIMTGLFPPSSGDARVDGYSVRDEVDQIRNRVGVCPQFDHLWPELTGAQHLRIFSWMRGVASSQVEAHIQERLEEVHLMDKKDVVSSAYSGGMQRRLSVAISMCGDPPVVFMDEPTTGMDPVARRQVWDIIENAKQGRAIILTTHSMEEADVLSDKIGIMARGEMKCIGSSLHLKNKFGSGYRLILIKDGAGTSAKKLERTLRRKFGSLFTSEVSKTKETVSMTVPRKRVGDMPKLFAYLRKNQKKLGLSDFTVSMTSLEDVFLHIVKTSTGERGAKDRGDDHSDEEMDYSDGSDSDEDTKSKKKKNKKKNKKKDGKKSKSKKGSRHASSDDDDDDDESDDDGGVISSADEDDDDDDGSDGQEDHKQEQQHGEQYSDEDEDVSFAAPMANTTQIMDDGSEAVAMQDLSGGGDGRRKGNNAGPRRKNTRGSRRVAPGAGAGAGAGAQAVATHKLEASTGAVEGGTTDFMQPQSSREELMAALDLDDSDLSGEDTSGSDRGGRGRGGGVSSSSEGEEEAVVAVVAATGTGMTAGSLRGRKGPSGTRTKTRATLPNHPADDDSSDDDGVGLPMPTSNSYQGSTIGTTTTNTTTVDEDEPAPVHVADDSDTSDEDGEALVPKMARKSTLTGSGSGSGSGSAAATASLRRQSSRASTGSAASGSTARLSTARLSTATSSNRNSARLTDRRAARTNTLTRTRGSTIKKKRRDQYA